MSVWAAIPLRGFTSGKSRLGAVLDAKGREALNRRLFTATVACATQALGADRVIIVSPDAAVIAAATDLGLTALCDPPKAGLDQALTLARQMAAEQGATALLSLSCDLPLLTAQDVQAACHAWSGPDTILLAPDEAGTGTNALIVPVYSAFTYHMGIDSAARHRDEALDKGLAMTVFTCPGTAFDLDTPADLERYPHCSLIAGDQ